MDILQLRVSLRGIEPTIYRILQVPAGIRLNDLHTLIQLSFEWENYHRYQFVKGEYRFASPRTTAVQGGTIEDDRIELTALLQQPGDVLTYEYDYADAWLHEIELQQRLDAEAGVHYPLCIEGERAGPPEDCGGPHGYSELLAELRNPKHAGYAEAREWMGARFDPGCFDRNAVNRRLLHLKF